MVSTGWTTAWDWPTLKAQIDNTRAMGANTWRNHGSVYAVASGATTRAAYLSKQTQIAAYIQSIGCWYYPTGFDTFFDGSVTVTQVHDELVALCTALQPYTANIAGFDINNENPSWTIANSTILADIKAALPGVPFTSSCSESHLITDDTFRATLDPYVDHFDQHLYNGISQPTTLFDALLAATAKPVLIGEFGKDAANSSGGISTYFGSIGSLAARVLPGGRGIAGCLQWNAQDAGSATPSDTTGNYGLYRVDGSERVAMTTPFRALPTA